ncbi:MAG: hypothetical protein QXM27_02845 [Candidatus Pacearchaeota archaeon]
MLDEEDLRFIWGQIDRLDKRIDDNRKAIIELFIIDIIIISALIILFIMVYFK